MVDAAQEPMLGADEIEEAPVPDDTKLATLAELGEKQLKLHNDISVLQGQLKAKEAELALLEEKTLPDALAAVNMQRFTLSNGYTIELTQIIRASIPEDKAPEAFAWLRENNAGDLIKRSLTVAFGRGEDERAAACVATLAKYFPDHIPEDKTAVHAGTLSAFVRERMTQGLPVPMDLLGVFTRNFAKIKDPVKPRAPRKKK